MATVYVLTEEPSAETVVRDLARRYVPRADVRVLPHRGKNDLCASFPKKMRAIRHPEDVRFIVLHDNDGADCSKLKARLIASVPTGVSERARIRIVMQELESWYLGQLEALSACELISETKRRQLEGKAKFRNPDELTNAKQEFHRLHGRHHQQITLAQLIGPHLDVERNRSGSFRLFVRTLQEFAE